MKTFTPEQMAIMSLIKKLLQKAIYEHYKEKELSPNDHHYLICGKKYSYNDLCAIDGDKVPVFINGLMVTNMCMDHEEEVFIDCIRFSTGVANTRYFKLGLQSMELREVRKLRNYIVF